MDKPPLTFTHTCPTCGRKMQVPAGNSSVFCVKCRNWANIVRDEPDKPVKQ